MGAATIARFLVDLGTLATLDLEEYTGQRAARPRGQAGRGDGDRFAFDVAEDRITRIWAVRNPDKLRAWNAV